MVGHDWGLQAPEVPTLVCVCAHTWASHNNHGDCLIMACLCLRFTPAP